MGRVKAKTAIKKGKPSRKFRSPTIHKKECIKIFANFIVDRIIEEQKNGHFLSKDVSSK